MKKMILLLLLCSSSYLFAQETADSMQSQKTKVKIKSKDNPGEVKVAATTNMRNTPAITTANPNSATIVLMTGWRTDPAILPVVGNGVSADVVTAVKTKYGDNVYDIKKIKITSGDAYAVRVMENGQYYTYYVGADGIVIAR